MDRPARLGRPREDRPIDLNATVEPYLGVTLIGLTIATVVLLVLVAVAFRRSGRLERRLETLTRGSDGSSLETIVGAHLDKVDAVALGLDDLTARTAVLEAAQRRAFQRVGLVRYNPFEETGGNQSFVLALLDAEGDGWVLTSLHARSGTRVYAKPVAGGRADAGMSGEETAAVRQAMGLTA